MVAVFVLIMGVTAAVGLAIFALNTSTNVVKQIVALGLAREGVEAVRNMRDTNWLKISTPDTDCYNPASGVQDAVCYKLWLDPPGANNGVGNDNGFVLESPGNGASYRLDYRVNSAQKFWDLNRENGTVFGLDLETDMSGGSFSGFYPSRNSGTGSSIYHRKITLNEITTPAPYDQAEYKKIEVRSQVWWSDRNCPNVEDWPGTGKCSVELITYLTNWKNY